MDNFMIGQFGSFDPGKLKKDYRKGFHGIEACSLKSEEDIVALKTEIDAKNLKLGIHFPLRDGVLPTRDALFLDLDSGTRRQAYRAIEEELQFIKGKNLCPEYMLFHYPKPVIIRDRFDLSRWRFSHRSEYVYESEYPYEKLVEYSEVLFQWLSEKSCEYNFIPVLELDAINRYISETAFLEALLDKYNKVKLCMDIGRLHVQDRIDPGFDAMGIIGRFAKHAEVIHLWNAKVGEIVQHSHFPLLPELKPEDGWADVEAYFKAISPGNKNAKLLFEHRSDLVSDKELDSCYSWINALYNKR